MSRAKPNSSTKVTALSVISGTRVVTLCFASLVTIGMTIAPAQESDVAAPRTGLAPSAFDFSTWPLLDLIDAKMNMAIFFRSGVPAELRLAALRRAWTADPAIRDFKGLSENEWNFEDLESIPGFGDLGPEINVPTMVAQIFGEPTRLALLSPTRPEELANSSSLANTVRRLIFGAAVH